MGIRTWLIGAGVIAAIAGLIYLNYVPVPESEADKSLKAVTENDWVKGNPQAPVVLVEYSDFECPACRAFAPLVSELEKKYGDQIAIIYRHRPLKEIHRKAEAAAWASEAAGKQGKFWEMHDLLFENQDEWADGNHTAKFQDYASQLGLNVEQFKRDINSKTIKGLVKADYIDALKRNVNATPTFFINGNRIQNPQGLDEFIQELEAAAREATGAATQGQ